MTKKDKNKIIELHPDPVPKKLTEAEQSLLLKYREAAAIEKAIGNKDQEMADASRAFLEKDYETALDLYAGLVEKNSDRKNFYELYAQSLISVAKTGDIELIEQHSVRFNNFSSSVFESLMNAEESGFILPENYQKARDKFMTLRQIVADAFEKTLGQAPAAFYRIPSGAEILEAAPLEEKTETINADTLDFEIAASDYIDHCRKPREIHHKIAQFDQAKSVEELLKICVDHINNMTVTGSKLSREDLTSVKKILLLEFADCEDQKRIKKLVDDAISFGGKHLPRQSLDSPAP